MLIIALVLNMLGIGLFCWLGLTLAVYALPCFVALSAGLAAVHAGASIASAALVAILAGAVTVLIGQTALIWARSTFMRAVIAGAFTVPAAVAGYHLAHGVAQIAMPILTLAGYLQLDRRLCHRRHGLETDHQLCRISAIGRGFVGGT